MRDLALFQFSCARLDDAEIVKRVNVVRIGLEHIPIKRGRPRQVTRLMIGKCGLQLLLVLRPLTSLLDNMNTPHLVGRSPGPCRSAAADLPRIKRIAQSIADQIE